MLQRQEVIKKKKEKQTSNQLTPAKHLFAYLSMSCNPLRVFHEKQSLLHICYFGKYQKWFRWLLIQWQVK